MGLQRTNYVFGLHSGDCLIPLLFPLLHTSWILDTNLLRLVLQYLGAIIQTEDPPRLFYRQIVRHALLLLDRVAARREDDIELL